MSDSSNNHQQMQALAVSPVEAARIMSIGRTKLFALIKDGSLRSVLLGRRRLILVDAIRECLASHEIKP